MDAKCDTFLCTHAYLSDPLAAYVRLTHFGVNVVKVSPRSPPTFACVLSKCIKDVCEGGVSKCGRGGSRTLQTPEKWPFLQFWLEIQINFCFKIQKRDLLWVSFLHNLLFLVYSRVSILVTIRAWILNGRSLPLLCRLLLSWACGVLASINYAFVDYCSMFPRKFVRLIVLFWRENYSSVSTWVVGVFSCYLFIRCPLRIWCREDY